MNRLFEYGDGRNIASKLTGFANAPSRALKFSVSILDGEKSELSDVSDRMQSAYTHPTFPTIPTTTTCAARALILTRAYYLTWVGVSVHSAPAPGFPLVSSQSCKIRRIISGLVGMSSSPRRTSSICAIMSRGSRTVSASVSFLGGATDYLAL